jgi:hypothetical protein
MSSRVPLGSILIIRAIYCRKTLLSLELFSRSEEIGETFPLEATSHIFECVWDIHSWCIDVTGSKFHAVYTDIWIELSSDTPGTCIARQKCRFRAGKHFQNYSRKVCLVPGLQCGSQTVADLDRCGTSGEDRTYSIPIRLITKSWNIFCLTYLLSMRLRMSYYDINLVK